MMQNPNAVVVRMEIIRVCGRHGCIARVTAIVLVQVCFEFISFCTSYINHTFHLKKIPFIFVSVFLTRFDFLEFGMCRSITCVSVTHNWCTMADIWIYNYSAAIRLGLTDKLWIDFQIINNFFQFSTSSFPLHYTTIPLNKTEHFTRFITFWNCLCQRSGWSDCLLTSHDRNRLPFFYYLVLELEISDSYYTSAIRIILPQINVSFPSYNYIQISATAAHSYV